MRRLLPILLLLSCWFTSSEVKSQGSTPLWAFSGKLVPNSSYDPNATTLFNAVEGAGGTLTTAEKNATNSLIIAGKAGTNWWANGTGGILNLVLGGTATPQGINAFNTAAFAATYVGTITRASTHMVSNGSTGYINTGWNPAVNDVDAFMTMAVWIRNTPADGVSVVMGAISATNRYTQIYPNLGSTFYGQINTNNVITENMGNTTSGLFIATRLNSTAEYVQKNSSRLDIGTTSSAITNNNIYVMCQNQNGTPGGFGVHQIAMYAIFPTPLTTAQAAQFYTDISTWITAMSR